jgi:predicted RNase H-like nuclease
MSSPFGGVDVMTHSVGVDWGSNGWVCARLETDTAGEAWSASVQPSLLSACREYRPTPAAPALVDIPVGLLEEGVRRCDRAAREALGGQRASVFLTPPRPVLDEETYADAKARTEALTGRSLSTQAWGLLPRIREMDDLLRSPVDPGLGVRESHPEVCFRALAAGDGELVSKHDAEGAAERLDILDDHVPGTSGAYERLVERHIETQPSHARRFRAGNDDDLVDAMGLAVTGAVAGGEFERFGGEQVDPVLDRAVEIVYATGEAASTPARRPTDAQRRQEE